MISLKFLLLATQLWSSIAINLYERNVAYKSPFPDHPQVRTQVATTSLADPSLKLF